MKFNNIAELLHFVVTTMPEDCSTQEAWAEIESRLEYDLKEYRTELDYAIKITNEELTK